MSTNSGGPQSEPRCAVQSSGIAAAGEALLGSLMQAIAAREPVHVLSHGTLDLERAVGIIGRGRAQAGRSVDTGTDCHPLSRIAVILKAQKFMST